MTRTWCKVPLYCLVAGWLCFQIEVRFLGRLALITLSDGSVTLDSTRWMILTFVLFVAVIAVGSLVIFKNMTRREIFISATVFVVINIIVGLAVYKIQGVPALFWAELSEWNVFITQLLLKLDVNVWVINIISWLTPYIFVLFGKKENAGPQ